MAENSNNYPAHEEVRQIFYETYNVFYLKWKDISNPADWDNLHKDMGELSKKYPYPICRQILLELVEIIEDGFKRRNEDVY